ncbi:MAG TPA: hypothetical protein VNU68_11955 [Verrucomicrobiae bacterium]|nr:hypothetical protein [Verrucomicrobiae bacterium]
MKTKRTIALFSLLALALPNQSRAQFMGSNQTNIISGVTSNWPGAYYIGSTYVFDALLIQNGGIQCWWQGQFWQPRGDQQWRRFGQQQRICRLWWRQQFGMRDRKRLDLEEPRQLERRLWWVCWQYGQQSRAQQRRRGLRCPRLGRSGEQGDSHRRRIALEQQLKPVD